MVKIEATHTFATDTRGVPPAPQATLAMAENYHDDVRHQLADGGAHSRFFDGAALVAELAEANVELAHLRSVVDPARARAGALCARSETRRRAG